MYYLLAKAVLINVLKIPQRCCYYLHCDPLPVIRDKGAQQGTNLGTHTAFPAKVFSQAASRM
jgi:hypothetical protein